MILAVFGSRRLKTPVVVMDHDRKGCLNPMILQVSMKSGVTGVRQTMGMAGQRRQGQHQNRHQQLLNQPHARRSLLPR